MEEYEEVTITVVLHMAQSNAEHVVADGVVNVDIEGDSVFLSPFSFWNDCALVEGIACASIHYQQDAYCNYPLERSLND
jgi:hypothetical protein